MLLLLFLNQSELFDEQIKFAMSYFCSSLCFDGLFYGAERDPLAFHFGAAMLSATCN